jgi:hypothetical protein
MSDQPPQERVQVRPPSEYSENPQEEFGRPGEFGDPEGTAARGDATLSDDSRFVNEHEGDVLRQLGRGPQTVEELQRRTGLDERPLMHVYGRLHEKGWVETLPDGRWRATDGAPRWGPQD